jgi:predicted AlkP superfamily pyrophosphatase or phosphodiesterase
VTGASSFLILILALIGTATADEAAEKTKRVLYLGIDGCRFDALTKAKTPHLDWLMADGIHSGQCLILGERYRKNDTISGPGWSTIYTGVWADKHGVHDNSFKGSNYAEFPHFFRRVKGALPEARCVSFVTWTPIHEFIVSDADVSKAFEFEKDYARSDAAAVVEVVKEIKDNDPLVVAYYIGNVDETGHKHGFHPSVAEYIAAIEQADRHVGEVLAAIESRKSYGEEEWLVVVTSDHGGKGTGHGGGHDVPEIFNSFLIVSGMSAERGEFQEQVYLVDAVPTILTFLGIKPDDAWKLDGRAVGLKK